MEAVEMWVLCTVGQDGSLLPSHLSPPTAQLWTAALLRAELQERHTGLNTRMDASVAQARLDHLSIISSPCGHLAAPGSAVLSPASLAPAPSAPSSSIINARSRCDSGRPTPTVRDIAELQIFRGEQVWWGRQPSPSEFPPAGVGPYLVSWARGGAAAVSTHTG